MKSNSELQTDVQNAIKWEPLLNASEIGVSVSDGVVSLTGVVDCYTKKTEAENAVKRVKGVKAIIESIVVKFSNALTKTNSDIANEVLRSLLYNYAIAKDSITVKVEDGWVTLEGEVPWYYQKEAAKNAVQYLIGVKGVTNNIAINSECENALEQKDIENAIGKIWSNANQNIKVRVSGTSVTLSGTIQSLHQKEDIERIAYKTPGIGLVNNELTVEYLEVLATL
jgi:osmotically-inducible protein OsmY